MSDGPVCLLPSECGTRAADNLSPEMGGRNSKFRRRAGVKTRHFDPASNFDLLENLEQAPELSIVHWVNSEPLTLAELKGKVVLLYFWTTCCFTCTLPDIIEELNNLHENYGPRCFVLIGVYGPDSSNVNNDPTCADEIVNHCKIRFPVAVDRVIADDGESSGKKYITMSRYFFHKAPGFYLIAPSGKIAVADCNSGPVYEGLPILKEAIEILLKDVRI